MITIEISNKKYNVKEAKSEEELEQGLKGVKELPEDEGMLFYIDEELSLVVFTMKGMEIPLDIIFINLDLEVIDVAKDCKPGLKAVVSTTEHLGEDDYIAYVLEVNPNSEIKVGDYLDFDEALPVMKVLALDGSTLMELWGGERIFRRAFTKLLINAVKKADSLKNNKEAFDALCRVIGRKMFKEIKAQDTRSPEYVTAPK